MTPNEKLPNTYDEVSTPKVSVLTPTFNRPAYLKETIRSVIGQRMRDWEMLIVNDGGEDVRVIVEDADDPRIRYFNRTENRGKAACLNFALERARGAYIAYIDDDDIWYPNHLEVLAAGLDADTGVDVVYSDLYAVQFLKDEASGRRFPIHKFIQVSRDFNRDFMFYFNHTLHVSLMHRKQLVFDVGGYDETITVLIDWNISRKFAYYTDFRYIPVPTGEYYMPITQSDRISNLERANLKAFNHNKRKIKADHPPEPWAKVDRIAVIFPVFHWNKKIVDILTRLIDNLCYPVRYLVINNSGQTAEKECLRWLGEIGRLKNVSLHTPPSPLDNLGAYRFGAEKARAEYVYLPTPNVDTELTVRLISARRFMQKSGSLAVKWPVQREQLTPFDVIIDRRHFLALSDPGRSSAHTEAAVMSEGLPTSLECDLLCHMADDRYKKGRYRQAYALIKEAEKLDKGGAGSQMLIDIFARVCFELEIYDEAEMKIRDLIARGYAADNWIRLGWILQRKGRLDEAIDAFRNGLEGLELSEEDLMHPVFPIAVDFDFGAFSALIGMGESMLDKGELPQAARMFRLASKLKANSHRPFLGFGMIFMKTNDLEKSRQALNAALSRSRDDPEVLYQMGCLMQRKRDDSSAFKFFSKLFEKGQMDRNVIDKINEVGTVLCKWGEMQRVFEQCLWKNPENDRVAGYLAAAYRKTGDFEKSKKLKGMMPLSTGKNDTRTPRENPVRRFTRPATFVQTGSHGAETPPLEPFPAS